MHTAVWAFFVGCIVAIPVAGFMGRFGLAWIFTGLVLLECGILAVNGGRCPLTDVAGRFTKERRPDFDIYLPVWVARWNKVISERCLLPGNSSLCGSGFVHDEGQLASEEFFAVVRLDDPSDAEYPPNFASIVKVYSNPDLAETEIQRLRLSRLSQDQHRCLTCGLTAFLFTPQFVKGASDGATTGMNLGRMSS